MKRHEIAGLIGFFAVLLVAAFLIREHFFLTFPILENSRLFFQLLVAALVVAVLRNAVGITTFGVFGPMIAALVLLQAGLVWGIFLFFNVFLVALAARLVFEPLKLPGAHRLAIVITTVGVYVSLIEIVGEFYHIRPLEFTILFPLIITSWLADRFATETRERGWYPPFTKFLWTSLVVVVAYLAMDYAPLIDFVVRTPETWAGLLAVNVFVGTKVRFRLMEYHRFRWLNPRGDVLTMSVRNREYVEKYNPRELFPQAEKAAMRERLAAAGVPVPPTHARVEEHRQLGDCVQMLQRLDSFVVKPSQGYGGEGILIVTGRNSDGYVTADGHEVGLSDIRKHLALILDGHYSNGPYDRALIERLIVPSDFFAGLCSLGLPDVRVLVFEGFPLMAMMRVPTQRSRGKANLHMGAVAVAVNISNGQTFDAFHDGRLIEMHPDTGAGLVGLEVPGWRRILEIACQAQAASGLGYVGSDVVVDRALGPLVLEVNKRPGLAIQTVNGHGLKARLQAVEERLPQLSALPLEEKVTLAMSWAANGWGRVA